jgi:hypothetical protein
MPIVHSVQRLNTASYYLLYVHKGVEIERKEEKMFTLSRKKIFIALKKDPNRKNKKTQFYLIFEDFQLYIVHLDIV